MFDFLRKRPRCPFKRGDIIVDTKTNKNYIVNGTTRVDDKWMLLVGDYLWYCKEYRVRHCTVIPITDTLFKIEN